MPTAPATRTGFSAIGNPQSSANVAPAPGPPPPAAPPQPNASQVGDFIKFMAGIAGTTQQQQDAIANAQRNLTLSGTSAQGALTGKSYGQQLLNAMAQLQLQGQGLDVTNQGIQQTVAQAWRARDDAARQLFNQRAAAGALTTAGTGYQRGLIEQQLKDALGRANLQYQQFLLARAGLGQNLTQAQQQYQNNMAMLGLSQGQSASQAQLAYLQAVANAAQTAGQGEMQLISPIAQALLTPQAGVG